MSDDVREDLGMWGSESIDGPSTWHRIMGVGKECVTLCKPLGRSFLARRYASTPAEDATRCPVCEPTSIPDDDPKAKLSSVIAYAELCGCNLDASHAARELVDLYERYRLDLIECKKRHDHVHEQCLKARAERDEVEKRELEGLRKILSAFGWPGDATAGMLAEAVKVLLEDSRAAERRGAEAMRERMIAAHVKTWDWKAAGFLDKGGAALERLKEETAQKMRDRFSLPGDVQHNITCGARRGEVCSEGCGESTK